MEIKTLNMEETALCTKNNCWSLLQMTATDSVTVNIVKRKPKSK